ncbi:xylose isomerase-like protein [Mollisia scopiformis]|uniref:Xylose isomerase-like protein n=1 Tax=Mollisia scopiformis TaxID=149040 RepID=A0A194X2D2_MOLSC|nr:xylose isomerase-like protein [Mollisia scopiformis]KUJ14169.1 xylose isomerase-like protein [Mollisia scopiformis]
MSYKPAICSMSLGRAWVHQITPKFTAAASAGLPGIEIFYEDLLYLASSYPGGATSANQLLAAHSIKSLCNSLKLEIIGIGPFNNCEGLLCPILKAQKRQELELWFQVAHILNTDIIQIPCTFLPESDERITGDLEIVARDLREIADLGARQNPPFRFAFENLCWGTYNDTWAKAWAVVEAVDRPNFGLCLDTFNIAGREFADPTREDGMVVNAKESFRESIKRMARTIDVEKVFYVQVVDAERLERKMDERNEFWVEGQRPRMSWSRNCRLFLCEEERGGYLPVMDVLNAICGSKEEGGMGYKGWVSMELFNRTLVDEREEIPMEHAVRAMESWKKIVERMGWEDIIEKVKQRKQIVSRRPVVENVPERVEISARL